MPSASRSIVINRAPRDVFDFVADGMNAPKWRPGGIEVRHDSGEGKGAVYRQSVPGPMGRRIAADYEVTAWDPPKRMAFKAIAGPVRPTGEYVLTAAGDGATKVTFSLDAKLGLLRRLLMSRPVQRSMDAEMRSLDKLKKVLEGKADTPAKTASAKTAPTSTAKPARASAKPAAKPAAKPTSRTSAKAAAKTPAKPAPKPTSRRSPRRNKPTG